MSYWSKVVKRLLLLLLSVVGVYLSFKLAVFYVPFLIAFVLSLMIEPAIRYLMRKTKLKRKTSAIIIFVLVFAIIAGLLIWGITTLIGEASNLLQGLNQYLDKAYDFINQLFQNFDFSKFKLTEQFGKLIQDASSDFLANISVWLKGILNNLINLISQVPTIAIYFVVTLLSLYFICTDKIYMLDQVEHHLPETWVKKMAVHIREITKTLGGYLKAQAMLILISFFISLIGLYLFKFMGFPIHYPLMIALGIGFVDALPILGSGTAMIPWAIIAALDGNLRLGIAIVILWAVMSIVRQFLEPRIVSGQIGIHPIFTLIAMYTGFRFMGIMGMLIGPILLIILKNIFATLIDKGILKSIFDR